MAKNIAKEIQLALFNSALGQVNRLNALLDSCALAASNLNAYSWYHTLRALRRELDFKTTTEDQKKLADAFKKSKNLLTINLGNRKHNKQTLDEELYNMLENTEMKLRRIADKAGLLTPSKKSFDESFGELMK